MQKENKKQIKNMFYLYNSITNNDICAEFTYYNVSKTCLMLPYCAHDACSVLAFLFSLMTNDQEVSD